MAGHREEEASRKGKKHVLCVVAVQVSVVLLVLGNLECPASSATKI